jgi:hypothetical protein
MPAITRKIDNHTLQTRILFRVQIYIPSHWRMQHTFETDLMTREEIGRCHLKPYNRCTKSWRNVISNSDVINFCEVLEVIYAEG